MVARFVQRDAPEVVAVGAEAREVAARRLPARVVLERAPALLREPPGVRLGGEKPGGAGDQSQEESHEREAPGDANRLFVRPYVPVEEGVEQPEQRRRDGDRQGGPPGVADGRRVVRLARPGVRMRQA